MRASATPVTQEYFYSINATQDFEYHAIYCCPTDAVLYIQFLSQGSTRTIYTVWFSVHRTREYRPCNIYSCLELWTSQCFERCRIELKCTNGSGLELHCIWTGVGWGPCLPLAVNSKSARRVLNIIAPAQYYSITGSQPGGGFFPLLLLLSIRVLLEVREVPLSPL